MTLYKNVDICDLESILSEGILSMDESGNNNWEDGKRANNPTDRVYLFHPINRGHNSFPGYGIALLEVNIPEAEQSNLAETDNHKDDYIEYTTAKVTPSQIKKIYVPEIFRKRLDLPSDIEDRIEWCPMTAKIYRDSVLKQADEGVLQQFAKTAEIKCSSSFNFFRGIDAKNRIFDLYEINYQIQYS